MHKAQWLLFEKMQMIHKRTDNKTQVLVIFFLIAV